jgi:uncharacterized 2Fe-2S/4Fe-4S cluster protein (DUF4445 family)
VLGNREWLYSASSPTGPAFEGRTDQRFGMRAAPGAIERVRIDPETKVARFRVIGEEALVGRMANWAAVCGGGKPKHLAAGICGSGIIEVVAEMFLAGILLPDGRFNPRTSTTELHYLGRAARAVHVGDRRAVHHRQPLLVTQDDVRSIQLAKAALYAGAKLLMKQAGTDSGGSHRAGRGVWQLHRSQIRHDFGADSRL